VPSFYLTKPTKPTPPYCVNEIMKTHTCSDYQIKAYNNEIDTYNSRMRSYKANVDLYISQLKSYIDDAVEYAQCEAINL
jgi:hypothetical protein